MAEYIDRELANAEGGGDAEKIKTPFAQIIVSGTAEKPYYDILWFDTKDKCGHIGYGSYYLDYVFKWLSECFEVTQSLWDEDVQPVVHGKWIDHMVRDWRCSECGEKIHKVRKVDGYCYNDKPNYCPNCGCRMDGGNE